MITLKSPAAATKPRYKKRNLVFLVWLDTCRIHLQAEMPGGISLDLQAGTWTFQGRSFAIGRRLDYSHIDRVGFPLGCYDRTKLSHLRVLKEAIEWEVDRRSPRSFDD